MATMSGSFPSSIPTSCCEGTARSGRLSKSGGVTGQQNGKTWTVTVKGLQIAENYCGTGPVVTLNGSFTCTQLN